ALVAILVERRREGGDVVLGQGSAVGAHRVGVEIAVRLQILIVLLQQHVPVVVDLPQRREPRALVVDGVGVVCLQGTVVGGRISSQVVRRRTGQIANRA